jgi:ATP phosphoribosyltransferase
MVDTAGCLKISKTLNNIMLKIAVQKSERVSKGFLDLLSKCGLNIEGVGSKLYYKFSELPIELYFVRGADIPALLQSNFDIAILGMDSFLEYNLDGVSSIQKKLGFAKCRLSFCGRGDMDQNLNGKTIATSYLNILNQYLLNEKIDAKIVEMSGSVESSIELGIANVIFDIVQTGSTLIQHGLHEYFKVLNLEAIMITKNGFESEILKKLMFRINAVLNGKNSKYLMFNLERSRIQNVLNVLPFGTSPTILDLADQTCCAIHTLCNEGEIWNVCESLQNQGARDIIITDIDLRFL